MRWSLPLLLLSSVAWADVSVTSSGGFDVTKCTMADGPLRREEVSLDVKKLVPQQAWLRQLSRRHLLLASREWDKSMVLDRASGKEVMQHPRYEKSPTALVENADGSLLGLLELAQGDHRLQLLDVTGKARWATRPAFDQLSDSASTLVAGDLLIVATYHRIATGSQLRAYDLKTGTPIWKADVLQLNVAHSKYWNDVSVEQLGQSVVLRGFEAGGCYVQTFDIATGKRFSAILPKR